MTPLTDDEIAEIEQKYLTRYNNELGRLVADLKAARAALRSATPAAALAAVRRVQRALDGPATPDGHEKLLAAIDALAAHFGQEKAG